MSLDKFEFDELDLELIDYVRDELEKRIGKGDILSEALMSSSFLNRLQEDPIYVHHFDEKYWGEFVYTHYEK